jgi:phosphoribosyl 1,2-cyclic phosphate phosphodiesterase
VQVQRSEVNGYARAQTIDRLKARFNYAFAGRSGYPPIISGNVLPEGVLMIGDIQVEAVDQPHGDIFSTGFLFKNQGYSVGYSTDFHDVTDEMLSFFAGVDVWVTDALRDRPHPTHAHLALTLEAIAKAKPYRSILTHMDNSMDYAVLAGRLPDGVEPGFDGLTVVLDTPVQAGSHG